MNWNVAGYRVTGYGHKKNQIPCQDDGGYFITSGGVCAFVADGLGSKRHSEIGSHLAVQAAINLTKQFFKNDDSERERYRSFMDHYKNTPGIKEENKPTDEEMKDPLLLMKRAFAVSRQALVEKAAEMSTDLEDLATTLVGALWTSDFLVLGHIGDGAVVGLSHSGEIKTLSAPENGESYNVVYPLTGPEAMQKARFQLIQEPQEALALFTDGIEWKCMHVASGTAYPKFFEHFFECIRHEGAITSSNIIDFLNSDRMNNADTDDDKTLMLIGKQAPVYQSEPIKDPARLLQEKSICEKGL